VASGIIDRAAKVDAKTSDPYVWGSVTKMTTGTGVLRLIEQGKISFDSKAAPLIDPFLKKMADLDPTQNFTSMADLWGPETANITVKDLLSMRSGVPDYDTASPSGG